ncbi:ABC transporter substrate-binding protein [Corynebacterium auriscanis]|uniref:ABC transporter substrate-binding protein n=1 Tax=Corynebacterium auriscanis TaxID=99807 RepID=UPI003CF189AF
MRNYLASFNSTPHAAPQRVPHPAGSFRARAWRRGVVAAASAVALSMGAVACSDNGGGNSTTGGESAGQDGSATGKITVKHSMGTTEVPKNPKRIVTMAQGWTDAFNALNVPVEAQVVSATANTKQQIPWAQDNAANQSITYNFDLQEITPEKIAELKPDVILAGWVPDEAYYKKLSDIAPTVPVLDKETGVDDWRQLTKIAGQIAGKENEANTLVEDVNNEVAETAKKYPNLKGKTFTWGMYFGGQYSAVANPGDPSNDMFTRLGFEVNPKLREFAKKENRVSISPERVDLLDSDLTLMWTIDGDINKAPGWKTLPVVKEGRAVQVTEAENNATSMATALSVRWALKQFDPVFKALNENKIPLPELAPPA